MKSSVLLASCGAILAAAGPILQGRRLYTTTDVVVEWVTVTVTEGDASTVFNRPVPHTTPTTTSTSTEPSSTSVAPPPPPPPPTTPAAPPPPPPAPTPDPSPAPAPAADSSQPQVQAAQPSSDTPPPAATQPAAAQPSDYTSTALYHHNIHRFNHSASALDWSDEHAQYAQTLAERCVFEHDT